MSDARVLAIDPGERRIGLAVSDPLGIIAQGLPIASVPIRTIYAGQSSHIRPWHHLTEFVRVTRLARRIVRGS